METIQYKDVRVKLTDILNGTQFDDKEFLITRRGRPAGIVISIEKYSKCINNFSDEEKST